MVLASAANFKPRLLGDRLFTVGNDEAEVVALVERLGKLEGLCGIGIEASGRYERLAVAELAAAGLPVMVLNPAQVRSYAQAIGQRAKTDPIDARVIALFVEAVRPELRPMPDEETAELAALMARRRQIVAMLTAEKLRRQRAAAGLARVSIARSVSFLSDELKSLNLEIDKTVRGNTVWRNKEDLLASVPGIGKTIARTLMAELPELGTLNPKQIAALAGLAPYTRQSGKMAGTEFHRGGPHHRAHRPVHGRARRCALQPHSQGLPRQARRQRQAKACRAHCHSKKAPRYPQRNPARPKNHGDPLDHQDSRFPRRREKERRWKCGAWNRGGEGARGSRLRTYSLLTRRHSHLGASHVCQFRHRQARRTRASA